MKTLNGESLAEAIGRVWAKHESIRSNPIDAIVPVPLHWQRRIQRGYNQCAALGRGLSVGLNVPLRTDLLKRIRLTPMQTAVSRGQRLENVKGTFRSAKRCEALRILLIDDVLTTGATASEAARVLKQSGAAQVNVAVIAHE